MMLKEIFDTLSSSFLKHFVFLSTEIILDQTFNRSNGTISGDMFFNGSVANGSGTNSGITYISSGSGGTQISSYPSFPYIDSTLYENLLKCCNLLQVLHQLCIDFDGSNQYIQILNSMI